jgi:hypothetical protein
MVDCSLFFVVIVKGDSKSPIPTQENLLTVNHEGTPETGFLPMIKGS